MTLKPKLIDIYKNGYEIDTNEIDTNEKTNEKDIKINKHEIDKEVFRVEYRKSRIVPTLSKEV